MKNIVMDLAQIGIIEYEQTNNVHLELNKTLDYMYKYGIDNVRGSCYSKVNLSAEEERSIRQLLSSRNDSCHKANKCDDYSDERDNT